MRNKHHLKNLVLLVVCFSTFLTLVACTRAHQATTLPEPKGTPEPEIFSPKDVPIPPEDAPIPERGKASISGALYSFTIHRILPETMFYLTPAVGPDGRSMPIVLIGPETDQGDVRGLSDSFGKFELNNIPPGNYYLLVWAPYNWEPAGDLKESLSPRLIELEEGDRETLGVLYVSWP
jgi:hypothetical protein